MNHLDKNDQVHMVDVSSKSDSLRAAVASTKVQMQLSTKKAIEENQIKKGNVLTVARIAGIMAVKKTAEIIPLCHSIPIHGVTIDFEFITEQELKITAEVKTIGVTGVEMEALTSVSVAALTIYDMCKSIDRGMTIGPTKLEQKSGGVSGMFVNTKS